MKRHAHPLRATAGACAWLLASAALAQDAPDERLVQLQLAQAEAQLDRQVLFDEGADHFAMAAGDMGTQRVVKGAPYCADAVHETVQWLPDGSGAAPNRIVRAQTSRLCRDGEGRTRQELDRNGRKLVYLRDPASRETWLLDPERKTARRVTPGPALAALHADAGAMRDFGERMREWARGFADSQREAARSGRTPPTPPTLPTPPTPPVPPTPPTPPTAATPPTPPAPVVITRTEDGRHHTEVRVVQLRGPEATEWTVPPPVQWRATNLAPRGAGSVQPLPAKDVEGVRANGERTTWVIEAGKVGNEKPIHITREVWTAPDLMLTVSSRDFDPRSGEVNYRLKGLKRGEPDAALMRVPADYKQPTRPGTKASQPTG